MLNSIPIAEKVDQAIKQGGGLIIIQAILSQKTMEFDSGRLSILNNSITHWMRHSFDDCIHMMETGPRQASQRPLVSRYQQNMVTKTW
ncbi:hypothetical protein U3C44_22855 (plasmid) [Enterobacter asburiae]|uniref:hypothetical protein n=1 Tax=Enterobacter asburiae TaxID=61645 RepID=UPI0029326BF2|nr:hypothetical protein [Enterobacter asburiae]EMA4739863.1 hypothetical protein [Enterobacter asburiae]